MKNLGTPGIECFTQQAGQETPDYVHSPATMSFTIALLLSHCIISKGKEPSF
uniref:Uncharacterized protein n=1 Tax=Anguilla anguilla TaxID=7936 RepID=A0A0E9UFR6_ANGAN